MSGAEVQMRLKLKLLIQGRADGLVALAGVLGWSDGKTFGMGRQIGLTTLDVQRALERSRDCTEVAS